MVSVPSDTTDIQSAAVIAYRPGTNMFLTCHFNTGDGLSARGCVFIFQTHHGSEELVVHRSGTATHIQQCSATVLNYNPDNVTVVDLQSDGVSRGPLPMAADLETTFYEAHYTRVTGCAIP